MSNQLNRIIESISKSDSNVWSEKLALVELDVGQILFNVDAPMEFVYFPVSCIISLKYDIDGGELANYALVGNEGVVGAFVFMGAGAGISSAKVEWAGTAYQMPIQEAIALFNRSAHVRGLILRYMQVLVADALQTSYCDAEHGALQKICRALLIFEDRLLGEKAAIPEVLVAGVAGIPAAELQEAVLSPQAKKLLGYDNGFLTIANRADMEGYCCECYRLIRDKLDGLLPI